MYTLKITHCENGLHSSKNREKVQSVLPIVSYGYLCGPLLYRRFQEFSFKLATAEKRITKDLPPPLGSLESNQ